MTTWHARITFSTPVPIGEDALFDLMEALATHGASVSITPSQLGGSVSVTIDAAGKATDAMEVAANLVRDALAAHIDYADIVGIEVMLDADFTEQLSRPLFPEVVGYAEIAEMAGVTRQRARKFASHETFPHPVIRTAHGPLMAKHAVNAWLKGRNTRPGRPVTA